MPQLVVRGIGTHWYEGGNFSDLLFVFLYANALPKRGLLQKERTAPQGVSSVLLKKTLIDTRQNILTVSSGESIPRCGENFHSVHETAVYRLAFGT